MADQQKIDNQDQFNAFLERELELRRENQAFLGETLSIGAQIADQIEHQLGKISQRLTLDKEILKSSRDSVNVVKRLSSSYSSINDVQKDQIKIQKQIQTNQNIIAAKSKFISEEDLKAARAYIEKEKALEKQQKLTADLLAQQEKMEAEFRAQEDAGKSLTQEQVAQRIVMEANVKASQASTAEITKQQIEASKRINNEAVSVELLKDQNEELSKADDYLNTQEGYLKQIIKNQALWNISLGAAEGFLKKMGLESATLSFGLEEGSKAAEEMAKKLSEGGQKSLGLIDQVRVLGAGIVGTVKGMSKALKEFLAAGFFLSLGKAIGKLFAMPLKPMVGFIKDLKSKFTQGIDYIKNEFFSLDSYIADAKAGDAFLQQMSQHTAELASNLGVGTKAARELTQQAGKMSASVGMMPEELAKTTGELQKAFGTTQKFSDDTVKTMGQMTNLYGLSNEEASEFVKLSQLQGKEASDTVLTYKTEIQALKERNNVALSEKEVMKEIAGMSAATQLTLRGQGKSLADAAFQAKKLGLEMGKVEGISSSLLSFEESIGKEMEAELLIGRDLQLDKARQAALQGDLATVAEEIANQVGSAEEFGKMNVMQQEALAAAVGMTRDELAKSLKTQELLADTGFKDMNEAQEAYRKVLKETGSEEKAMAAMKAKGASDALQDQFREISLQEKRAQQERDVLNAQVKMAQATNKLFDAFAKINKVIKDIKAVIVTAMKPFFDSFGKTVGEGGKAFKEMILPYAERLGNFMNGVGLRIVDIVKSSGPQLKNIFEGVLTLFSNIYQVVGKVIAGLVGVQNTGKGTGSTFESISNVISTMVDYLENLDISTIVDQIKGFIAGIKSTFAAIGKIITSVGKFFGDNPGVSKMAGLGTFAFTLAPGAVKDIAGSVGGAIKDKAIGGLKAVGANLGNKLTEKLGLGKLFGSSSKKPTGGASDPLFVQDVGGGAAGKAADILGKGGKANILKQFKTLLKKPQVMFRAMAQKGSGFTKVLGKLGQNAGKLGLNFGKLGANLAKGGLFAAAGMAAEYAFGHFADKSREAGNAMDEQIAVMDEGADKDKAIQAQKDKYAKADALAAAGTVAKYTAMGAGIGSMIPVVGTAVGAVVGFTAGVVLANRDYQKEQKFRASKEYETQKRIQRAQIKLQKAEEQQSILTAQIKLKAAKEGAAAELEVKKQFAEQLGGAGTTLESLGKMDVDYTSDAFKQLALDALNAGNVTEEEYTAALKGTLDPLEFMNKAASNASKGVKKLYDSAMDTAQAIGGELKKALLEQAGVNEEVVNAQLGAINTLGELNASEARKLADKYGDELTSYSNTDAVEFLRGEDEDSKKLREELIARYEKAGASQEQIDEAMKLYARQLEETGTDFELSSAAALEQAMGGIGEQLKEVMTLAIKEADAEVAQKQAEALQMIQGTDIIKQIADIKKEDLATNQELASLIESLGINMEDIMEGGILGDEQEAIKKAIVDGIVAGQMGAKGSNPELFNQLQGALNVDDFIIRPGQPPIKFNKDDLVIGGTKLGGDGSTGGSDNEALKQEVRELKEIMAGFVQQMATIVNRPVVVELDGNKVGETLGRNSFRVQ